MANQVQKKSCCESFLSCLFPCCCPIDVRTDVEKANDERLEKIVSQQFSKAVIEPPKAVIEPQNVVNEPPKVKPKPKHHKVASTDVLNDRQFMQWLSKENEVEDYMKERQAKK